MRFWICGSRSVFEFFDAGMGDGEGVVGIWIWIRRLQFGGVHGRLLEVSQALD